MMMAFLDGLTGSPTRVGLVCATLALWGLAPQARALDLAFPPLTETDLTRAADQHGQFLCRDATCGEI